MGSWQPKTPEKLAGMEEDIRRELYMCSGFVYVCVCFGSSALFFADTDFIYAEPPAALPDRRRLLKPDMNTNSGTLLRHFAL